MIRIRRDSGYADSLRAYKIVLDDNVIGEIRDGQQIVLEVPPGRHRLYLKIDWGRSNIVNFETNGNTIDFECGSSLRGFKILLAFLYATFLSKEYIWLKKS